MFNFNKLIILVAIFITLTSHAMELVAVTVFNNTQANLQSMTLQPDNTRVHQDIAPGNRRTLYLATHATLSNRILAHTLRINEEDGHLDIEHKRPFTGMSSLRLANAADHEIVIDEDSIFVRENPLILPINR